MALILLAVFSAPLHPQADVVHASPIRLRHLVGTVVDSRGLAVAYSAIELRDAQSHQVLATTFADGNGKFFFADRKRGDQLELRISLTGFKSVQYTIQISALGKPHLRAVLPVATQK
jgi:hypothetical protein